MKTRSITRISLFAAPLLLVSHLAQAEPGFARLYKSQFGFMPSCNACHVDGGGSPLNAYGKSFDHAGHNAAAFTLIAAQDSDADGVNNADEGEAQSNPGNAASTPDKPGNWLDVENLIPKPVQNAFAEVKTYKPLDAIFTDDDVERAAAMGVVLTKADETVIYLPVSGGKPVGMAVILPIKFNDKNHFVLVTTTRKLEVDHVAMVNDTDLDVGDLQRFKGQFAPKVEAITEAATAAEALAYAVKKAGVMIYVRLKRS